VLVALSGGNEVQRSVIALVRGTAGLVLGSLLSNVSAAPETSCGEEIYIEGSARWQYKGAGNPAR